MIRWMLPLRLLSVGSCMGKDLALTGSRRVDFCAQALNFPNLTIPGIPNNYC